MNYRLRGNILDYAAFDHMDAEDFDYEVRQLLAEHGDTARAHLTLLGSHDTARIRTVCNGDVGRTLIAIALQMTLPGVPMVYYGDEIGMEGENDPDCRRPMIWDKSRWNMPIYEATKTLIRLRHDHPALRTGSFEPLKVFNGVYAFARAQDDDCAVVITNPRMEQPQFHVPLGALAQHAAWLDVLSGVQFRAENGTLNFQPLNAASAYVLIPVRD